MNRWSLETQTHGHPVSEVVEADSLFVSGGALIFFRKVEKGRKSISLVIGSGNYIRCIPVPDEEITPRSA